MSTQDTKSPGTRHASTSTTSAERDRSGPVTVEIQGQRLSIRSDREPSFVHGLADYVDEKVEALQKAAPTASMDKLLMLASLTVAEELFESRQELRQLRRQVEERTASMAELIDEIEQG